MSAEGGLRSLISRDIAMVRSEEMGNALKDFKQKERHDYAFRKTPIPDYSEEMHLTSGKRKKQSQ